MRPSVRSTRQVAYATPFNVTGMPAVTLPLRWTTSGLRLAVQIVSASGRDEIALAVAAELEPAASVVGASPSAGDNPRCFFQRVRGSNVVTGLPGRGHRRT